jgi:quercetin 2,3-dioxygenase
MTPPTYHRGHFDRETAANGIHCLVGNGDGDGVLPIRQDLSLHRLVSAGGRTYGRRIAPRHGAYLFVVEGAAEINGRRLERRDSIGLVETDRLTVTAMADGTDLLLVDTAL